MKKKERLFRGIALVGFGLGLYALVRYEFLLMAFNEATEELRQIGVDLRFADIADHYNQEGEN